MLLPCLINKSLQTSIRRNATDYASIHESLRKCAKQMQAKYKEKLETTYGGNQKLRLKSRAVEVLLIELSKVTLEDAGKTREVISSALKCHAEVLQGHEHLFSKEGNSYALMKQTKRLRMHDDERASLLEYHDLKNKLLGPNSPDSLLEKKQILSEKQIELVSELVEKQGLTLRILKNLKVRPCLTGWTLETLHKAGMFDPDLCGRVFEHRDPDSVAQVLLELSEMGLFNADLPNLCDEVLKRESPEFLLMGIKKLNEAGLLEPEFCVRVIKHQFAFSAASILAALKEAGLLKKDLYDGVLNHEDSDTAAAVLIELNRYNLVTESNCSAVLKHPDIAKLGFEIEYLKKSGKLDQESFEDCLARTGSATNI